LTNNTKIPFKVQTTGYDRDQVDRYIQKLADEYKNMQQKLEQVSARPVQQSMQPDITAEAISKAMVDAEIKAIQIVAEAKNEADRIIGNAYIELGQLQQAKERAYLEIGDIINELKELIPIGRRDSENTGANQPGIY